LQHAPPARQPLVLSHCCQWRPQIPLVTAGTCCPARWSAAWPCWGRVLPATAAPAEVLYPGPPAARLGGWASQQRSPLNHRQWIQAQRGLGLSATRAGHTAEDQVARMHNPAISNKGTPGPANCRFRQTAAACLSSSTQHPVLPQTTGQQTSQGDRHLGAHERPYMVEVHKHAGLGCTQHRAAIVTPCTYSRTMLSCTPNCTHVCQCVHEFCHAQCVRCCLGPSVKRILKHDTQGVQTHQHDLKLWWRQQQQHTVPHRPTKQTQRQRQRQQDGSKGGSDKGVGQHIARHAAMGLNAIANKPTCSLLVCAGMSDADSVRRLPQSCKPC
jgi:hypothetical protein